MTQLRDTADPSIGVIGLGRVGLVTAVGLSELGWKVFGTEEDPAKAQAIRQGIVPFYEPGVEELLKKHISSGQLTVESSLPAIMDRATVLFLCVGTPEAEDGSADISKLIEISATIGEQLSKYTLIVEKSTSPVTTAEQLKEIIAQHSSSGYEVISNCEFDVAVNPEFLREGRAMQDFLEPSRIVLGVENDRASSLLSRVYKPLFDRLGTDQNSSMILTDTKSAEIIKHAANAFLATKVSFANMVSDLCEVTGANIDDVTLGLEMDPRIGQYLKAGIGYGGSCLPKDVRAFTAEAERHGVDFSILREVHRVNEHRVQRYISKLKDFVPKLETSTIAVWGLAFKPGTDDVRDAPSLRVVGALLDEGASLRLSDPRAISEFSLHFPESDRLIYKDSPEEAAEQSDAILILTEWREYIDVDLRKVLKMMRGRVMVDGRNAIAPEEARTAGFKYQSIGRS